eukprot:m.55939 g.55939  ORF g.55939 m.55939 type:complete len:616 (-) comp12979_c1_seq2:412-2259(-)
MSVRYLQPAYVRGLRSPLLSVILDAPRFGRGYHTGSVTREDAHGADAEGLFCVIFDAHDNLLLSWVPVLALQHQEEEEVSVDRPLQYFQISLYDVNHIRIQPLPDRAERVVIVDRYQHTLMPLIFRRRAFSVILTELESNNKFTIFRDIETGSADTEAVALLPPKEKPSPDPEVQRKNRSSIAKFLRYSMHSMQQLVSTVSEVPPSRPESKTVTGSADQTITSKSLQNTACTISEASAADDIKFLSSFLETDTIPTMHPHQHEAFVLEQANELQNDPQLTDEEQSHAQPLASSVESNHDENGLLFLGSQASLDEDDMKWLQETASLRFHQLWQRVYETGVPHACRCLVWPYLLGVYTWNCSKGELLARQSTLLEEYKSALRLLTSTSFQNEEALGEHARVIACDIERTDLEYVKLSQQDKDTFLEQERNIMHAYMYYNRNQPYSQAMPDLLEPILAVMGEPHLAFKCFSNVMTFARCRFDREDPNYAQRQLGVLQRLLRMFDPVLHDGLSLESSDDLFTCYRWLLVDFKRELSVAQVLSLWEKLWAARWLVSTKVPLLLSLAILRRHRKGIIGKDAAAMLAYFNQRSFDEDFSTIFEDVTHLLHRLKKYTSKPVE